MNTQNITTERARLNWRRGFFRIWIVLSILWFSLCAVQAWKSRSLESLTIANRQKFNAEHPKGSIITDEEMQYLIYLDDQEEALSSDWKVMLILGIGMPVAALFVGAMAWWIGRGFKS